MAIYGPGQANKPVGGGFKEQLMGSPGRYRTETNYDPRQLQNFEQIGQMGMNNMQNPYQGFEPIQNEAMRQFNTQTVPGIAEQFTAMGGGQRSSNFGKSLGQAGAGLQSMLAAQRAQYGQNQQDFGLRQAGLGQTQKYSMEYEPGQEGLLSKGLNLAAQAGMHYATGGLSGVPAMSNLLGQGVEAFKNYGKKGQGQAQGQGTIAQRYASMPYEQQSLVNDYMGKRRANNAQAQFSQAQQGQMPSNYAPQQRGAGSVAINQRPPENGVQYRNPDAEFGQAISNYYPASNPQQYQGRLQPHTVGANAMQLNKQEKAQARLNQLNYPALSNPNYVPVGAR